MQVRGKVGQELYSFVRQKASCWLRVLAIVYVVAHLTTMAALAFQSNPVAGSSSTPMAGKPDWQQVERALLEAAKQSPDDFGAQQRLGELYLQQNRLSEGIVYLGGGTPVQTACGFEDSVDNMVRYLLAACGPEPDEAKTAHP